MVPNNGSTLSPGSEVKAWYQLNNNDIGAEIPSHLHMSVGILLVKDANCSPGAEESVIQQWAFFWPTPNTFPQITNTTMKIGPSFPFQFGNNSVKVRATLRNGNNQQVGEVIQQIEDFCFPYVNTLVTHD